MFSPFPGRPTRDGPSCLPAADVLLLVFCPRFLARAGFRATLLLPGQTEAGSAGAQPDQGITRPTVYRDGHPKVAPNHAGGWGPCFSLPLGHPSDASQNAPPSLPRLPAGPAAL